jgi:hypothetical protein
MPTPVNRVQVFHAVNTTATPFHPCRTPPTKSYTMGARISPTRSAAPALGTRRPRNHPFERPRPWMHPDRCWSSSRITPTKPGPRPAQIHTACPYRGCSVPKMPPIVSILAPGAGWLMSNSAGVRANIAATHSSGKNPLPRWTGPVDSCMITWETCHVKW